MERGPGPTEDAEARQQEGLRRRRIPIAGRLGLPLLVLLFVALLLNGVLGSGAGIGDPLDDLQGTGAPADSSLDGPQTNEELVEFLQVVLDDLQGFWSSTFEQSQVPYRDASLTLFENVTASGCGGASKAVGPHYCPLDETIYLDINFFRDLRDRFGAPGDFALAYVVAHELGHHVQQLMGISTRVAAEQRADPSSANQLSIRLELQADCLAGVWAFTTYERRLLEEGDLEEGLNAAAAVGDDRIQQQATGMIDPESWTHGSSDQRVRWFSIGFEQGDPNACDTFSATEL
ncbi:MAG TPA: neutral zinc metallopeptidase [Actinomycetota bacterium]|nr:neutral zinc metallopeptidase [Actinomycetota bacterium]